MELNKKYRRILITQNIIFVVLFLAVIGLTGWLSHRYNTEFDLTSSKRHSLSEETISLLAKLDTPITLTAFARDTSTLQTRKNIRELVERYRVYKQDIDLQFIDPLTQPDEIQRQNIKVEGEVIVELQSRKEHIQNFTEQTFTNTLQRLLRSGERQVVFITGHGERSPDGIANHDFGEFINTLGEKGISTKSLNLFQEKSIPDNTAAVVIASPRVAYHKSELNIIRDYVKGGGNLLWFHDPGSEDYLGGLADDLGIGFLPGVIVDVGSNQMGNPPTLAIGYVVNHPITSNFVLQTLFPHACGITAEESNVWEARPFIESTPASWSETSELGDNIQFDQNQDIPGPFTIGLTLTTKSDFETTQSQETPTTNQNQRIAIVCDGDFLSNSYLGNLGNQDLGFNLFNWITNDDEFIDIGSATDTDFTLTITIAVILFVVFFLLVPLALVISGIVVWLKRRKA